MSDELSDDQVNELARDLQQLELELVELLEATQAGTKPVKLKDNQGRLSRMDELHNQSILVANRNVTENRLKAVRAAQVRLSDASFGYCTLCDEVIAFNRLKAYPDAAMCITCQSDMEQKI